MGLDIANKYLIAFPSNNKIKQKIIKALAENGNSEIVSLKKEIELDKTEIQKIEYLISTCKFSLNFISQFYKPKISLIQKILHPKIEILPENFEGFLTKEKSLKSILFRIEEIEKTISNLKKKDKILESKIEFLEKLKHLNFIPSETKYTKSKILIISIAKISDFKQSIYEFPVHLKTLYQSSGKIILSIIYLKSYESKILEYFKKFKIEILNYEYNKIPIEILKDFYQQKKEIFDLLKELEKEIINIGKESYEKLKIYFDLLNYKKIQLLADINILEKELYSFLCIFSFRENIKVLEKKFKKISKDIYIIKLKLEKSEDPPVVLKNNNLIKPFESVTNIFGMPQPKEIDPTPFLSLFFISFFAICLTDSGYGLIMLIFSLVAILIFHKILPVNFMKLIFYAGIFTLIIGALFGSYFGLSPEVIKIPGQSILLKLKKIDPINDTLIFMGLSLGLGYIQITFSQIVRVISAIRNKDKSLLLLGISWFILYCTGFLIIGSLKFFPNVLNYIKYILILPLALVLYAESLGTKIFLKPLVGIVKLIQGLIGTMSDILSYSRLMALGLATAIIAMIINKIAVIFKEMVPYIGFLVAIPILIGGHLFNLGINALGGFIHSGRLQFVEFFPKFLEGGGRRFRPLKQEFKYIELKNNNQA